MRSTLNVVDSSGWLAYLDLNTECTPFDEPLAAPSDLIVPSVSIYEVFKAMTRMRGEEEALQAVSIMTQARVIDLDLSISLAAARLSTRFRLPMADSIILATAYEFDALLWTQDRDFDGIPNVNYFPKTSIR